MTGPSFVVVGLSFVAVGLSFVMVGLSFVMVGLGPTIHDFTWCKTKREAQVGDARPKPKSWMPGPGPGMTKTLRARRPLPVITRRGTRPSDPAPGLPCRAEAIGSRQRSF
jgi:hypothetical protein